MHRQLPIPFVFQPAVFAVLPPIRLKHPVRRPSHQQVDRTDSASLWGHHGRKQISGGRLPPLDQYSSQVKMNNVGVFDGNCFAGCSRHRWH